jgi:hypothetical protein
MPFVARPHDSGPSPSSSSPVNDGGARGGDERTPGIPSVASEPSDAPLLAGSEPTRGRRR